MALRRASADKWGYGCTSRGLRERPAAGRCRSREPHFAARCPGLTEGLRRWKIPTRSSTQRPVTALAAF
eukprot:3917709-Rhodomonas_salina.6